VTFSTRLHRHTAASPPFRRPPALHFAS